MPAVAMMHRQPRNVKEDYVIKSKKKAAAKKAEPKNKAPAEKVPKKKKVKRMVREGPSAITMTPTLISEAEVLEAFDVLGITAQLTDPAVKKLFVKVAVMNNLNPLKREIHAVERNKKVVTYVPGKGDVTEYVKVLTPVTGYEVFLDRAEESRRLQYWYPIEDGDLDPKPEKDTYKVTIVIKRKDWPKEFHWTVKHSEVSVDNPMWKKEPSHMTMKVAISRAFRLCFRDVLRGMPFTVEEEYAREDMRDVTPGQGMIEPKAKGLLAAAETKTPEQIEAEELARKLATELRIAQEELQAVYSKCVDSKLYVRIAQKDGTFKDERKDMLAMAIAAKENVNSLRDLAVAWQIDLAERIEKAQKEAKK